MVILAHTFIRKWQKKVRCIEVLILGPHTRFRPVHLGDLFLIRDATPLSHPAGVRDSKFDMTATNRRSAATSATLAAIMDASTEFETVCFYEISRIALLRSCAPHYNHKMRHSVLSKEISSILIPFR